MDSYSNLPHSYDGENASCNSLMGDYNFTVADYEVFTPVSSSKWKTSVKFRTTKYIEAKQSNVLPSCFPNPAVKNETKNNNKNKQKWFFRFPISYALDHPNQIIDSSELSSFHFTCPCVWRPPLALVNSVFFVRFFFPPIWFSISFCKIGLYYKICLLLYASIDEA